ncbi:MAG: hypothetical protein EOO06_08065 [Chitinophagaceae bacterium]|nr:MAG: hypothetical protein EOO06_08065 [Chitinophagaceae bacterium]
MKLIKTLALILMFGVFGSSCEKEYSEENGGGTGAAAGTLKASGTGECLPSSVRGIYIAGTALNATNYINVDVNITAIGAYTISTNVVNGYSFAASGIATSTGVQTIKLVANAGGNPTAAGANTFTVKFGTSQCNIVVDVFPTGTGNAVISAIDCTGSTPAGTYTQGVATSASNTVQVDVTATTAGIYNITTNTQNGVSFSGTGMLINGSQMVTLTATGTPTNAGAFTYTVGSGATSCTFSVTYATGTTPPPTGGFTWKFNVGATVYQGTCEDAMILTSPLNFITITGTSTSGTGTMSIVMTNAGGALTTGDYLTSAMSGKFAVFTYSDGTVDYTAGPGVGNMTIKVTGITAATEATGTFSGTAATGGGSGSPVTITGGQFKANIP